MGRGIVVLLLVMLVACAAKPAQQPSQSQPIMQEIKIVEEDTTMPAKPMYEPPPTGPEGVDVEIKIDAKQFEFLPDDLVVRKGNKVRLIITSQDMTHKFIMPAYGIDEELPQGQDVVIEFVADKSGDFTFSCIPEHTKQGMKGTFHVI